MHKVYLGCGSNMGDRRDNIEKALQYLRDVEGIESVESSPLYETAPVGGPEQGDFLNGVIAVETFLDASMLLGELLKIEQKLGRERTVKNGPRTIDLDVLFCGEDIIETEGLCIPHPRLHERWFVLKPLCDLNPNLVHPKFKKSVHELLEHVSKEASDTTVVKEG